MVKRIEHETNESGNETKWCGKCKQFLLIETFGVSKQTWDKLRPTCKNCLHEDNVKNKEKRTEYNKKYWEETKEAQTEKHQKWASKNKEHVKQYNQEYRKEHGKEIDQRDWQKRKNDEIYLEQHRIYKLQWCRDKRKNDPQYQIYHNFLRRIRDMMTNYINVKKDTSEKYVGCHIYQFRHHLESRFKEGMTWQNYGKSWHIDHIIPASSFDMKRGLQKRACFFYKNLQPLWKAENIHKSNNFCAKEKAQYMKDFVFYCFY